MIRAIIERSKEENDDEHAMVSKHDNFEGSFAVRRTGIGDFWAEWCAPARARATVERSRWIG